MALPKLSELSPVVQMVVILAVGGAVWAASEYVVLQPVSREAAGKRTQSEQLTKEVEPLRHYRDDLQKLSVENKQLEAQLENLQRIVPDEKEVDNLMRQVQGEALTAGVLVRRFTAKALVPQQYYTEVPFEVEMDGSFYDVLQFYERLGRLERIINVSTLKMGGIEAKKSVGQKSYTYGSNETVVAICTVTTFFSKEQEAAPAAPGRPSPPRAAAAPVPAARR